MNVRVLILADDLSGAADCAAPFAARGFRTIVTLGEPHGDEEALVLAIDAGTRRLRAGPAGEELARLVTKYAEAAGQILYLKIDSTLRGNVGAEIAAAWGALRKLIPHAKLVVAPAFPAQGRVTRGGRQYVNGTRVEVNLPAVLAQAGLTDAVVLDAESEKDLAAIATSAPREALWVGSGGLARHIDLLKAGREPAPRRPRLMGPILFVVGTNSAVSHEQADALAREPGVKEVSFDPASMKATSLLIRGDVLVRLPRKIVMEPDAARFAVAYFLTSYVEQVGALVLTGGDTARAVLQTIGVTGLRVWGETEPGVALSIAMGAWVRPVITKAGGFGDASTLVRCRALLKGSKLG